MHQALGLPPGDSVQRAAEAGEAKQELRALKARLTQAKKDGNESEYEALQMRLARLGEKRQQQDIVCDLYSRDPGVVFIAANRKVPSVGGGFAVFAALALFRLDAVFEKNHKRYGDYDAPILGFPSLWAWGILAAVIPDSPYPPPLHYPGDWAPTPQAEDYVLEVKEKKNQAWRRWVSENRARVIKMDPAGGGIDYSGRSCRWGGSR